jgi:hypothetical protein
VMLYYSDGDIADVKMALQQGNLGRIAFSGELTANGDLLPSLYYTIPARYRTTLYPNCIVLYYAILYYTIPELYCTILYCTVLYYIIL